MSQQAEQPSNDRPPADGIMIGGQFTERLPRVKRRSSEFDIPTLPLHHKTGAINPNVALLLACIGYVLVNCFTLMLLVARAIDLNPFDVLAFFAFIAPVAASLLVLATHFTLEKGFHPLALAGFLVLMLVAAIINFQFFAQAVAAV
jgi:hypothetical protein